MNQTNIKVLLAGNIGVGKTSLLLRFTQDEFEEEKIYTTIGVESVTKSFNMNEEDINLQLWDTAGQERYRTLTSSFYYGAEAIFLVYDVTDMNSFLSLNQWKEEIDRYSSGNAIKVLIGNKCDLLCKKQVDFRVAKEFADSLGMQFYEVSSKSSLNVNEAFLSIVREMKRTKQVVRYPSPIVNTISTRTQKVKQVKKFKLPKFCKFFNRLL